MKRKWLVFSFARSAPRAEIGTKIHGTYLAITSEPHRLA